MTDRASSFSDPKAFLLMGVVFLIMGIVEVFVQDPDGSLFGVALLFFGPAALLMWRVSGSPSRALQVVSYGLFAVGAVVGFYDLFLR